MNNKKMSSMEVIRMYDQYVGRTYDSLPVVPIRAQGVEIWDPEEEEYLDFWASYSALNLGHRHPEIIETVIEQLTRGPMFTRACYNEQLALLGKEMNDLVGFDGMIIPKNAGVEGFETAIKTARMWAYRTGKVKRNRGEIIVARGNFHGRTVTAVSASSEPQYKDDFGPHTPGFVFVPYGDVNAIIDALTKNTIAILLEPIQGEGGIIVPPEDYLQEVRRICDTDNILFILDEIQTGLGRTGKMFCYLYSNIKPDVLILGKSIGGGVLPISLVFGRRDIMKLWQPGDDGSTFGGYAMASAVARKSLEITIREKLSEKSAILGKYFMNQLQEIKSSYIKEVRGRGLFIGIELFPEAGGARKYCERLLRESIICKEAHHNVMRFSPPLIVTKNQLDFAAAKIDKVLRD